MAIVEGGNVDSDANGSDTGFDTRPSREGPPDHDSTDGGKGSDPSTPEPPDVFDSETTLRGEFGARNEAFEIPAPLLDAEPELKAGDILSIDTSQNEQHDPTVTTVTGRWERVQEWLDSEIFGPAEFAVDFVSGTAMMAGRYVEMLAEGKFSNPPARVGEAQNKRDDHFHCLAHCESTALGPGGEAASHFFGDLKEMVDFHRQTLTGSRTVEFMKEDVSHDLAVNQQGRDLTYGIDRSGLRCYDACGRTPLGHLGR